MNATDGKQVLLDGLEFEPKPSVPLSPTMALVKFCSYKRNVKGKVMTVVHSSQRERTRFDVATSGATVFVKM